MVMTLTDLSFPPPGSATKPPTAVTAATSCAVGAAITPTRTAWWSGVTASTTGAATSPAAGVNAPWSATSASEAARAPPLCRGAVPPEDPLKGLETPWTSLPIPDARRGRRLCCDSIWKPPGTGGLVALGGPGHQRKPIGLKITWQPGARVPTCCLPGCSKKPGQGWVGLCAFDLQGQKDQPPRMFFGTLCPPHGTTNLGCKFLFFFPLSFGMRELQKYL